MRSRGYGELRTISSVRSPVIACAAKNVCKMDGYARSMWLFFAKVVRSFIVCFSFSPTAESLGSSLVSFYSLLSGSARLPRTAVCGLGHWGGLSLSLSLRSASVSVCGLRAREKRVVRDLRRGISHLDLTDSHAARVSCDQRPASSQRRAEAWRCAPALAS